MDPEGGTEDRCGGCGLAVKGGAEGCQAIMDEVLALHFGNAAYFGVHRLFVDAYCLQHADRYCVSFKSLAAHLAHLCWTLERGGSRAIPSEAIRRWVECHPGMEKPPLPRVRHGMTVADISKAADAEDHHRAVERWARAVWEAHADLHPVVRGWVRQALGEEGGAAGAEGRGGFQRGRS